MTRGFILFVRLLFGFLETTNTLSTSTVWGQGAQVNPLYPVNYGNHMPWKIQESPDFKCLIQSTCYC